MSRVSNLYRLQRLDLEIDRQRSRLKEIESVLANSDPVARAREALALSEARVKAAAAASKAAELEITALNDKLAGVEKTLYGGSVRNPKELQDLEHEVEALKRHRPRLEDHLLEAMLELEEAELQRNASRQEQDRLEGLHAAQSETLAQEAEEAQSTIERLEGEREAAQVDVSEPDRLLYDQLRAGRGPIVVALLQDDCCAACGLVQANSIRQTIRAGSELIRCRQCGRILYAG